MTPEAQAYIRALLKEDSRKFFEINEDSQRGITSAVLNEIALTPDEIDYIRYFIKNGSPTLVIEYRPYEIGISSKPSSIFIDGKEIPVGIKLNLPGSIYDGQWTGSPIDVSFSELDLKHAAWSYFDETALYKKLRETEVAENYEECIEIQEYAEKKGWDLKKKK